MKKLCVSLLLLVGGGGGMVSAQEVAVNPPKIHPMALFTFEERGSGVKGYGAKVTDILLAQLLVKPDLYVVDRQELSKTLAEHELNLSGAVSTDQAVQVGKLTGAKIIVTGSVLEVDRSIYLVAKIIGVETSRVLGEAVKGKAGDDLAIMAETLAEKVAAIVIREADKLMPREVNQADRLAALKQQLGDAPRPTVLVHIVERHVGQATIDPAAQTELILLCRETGFDVLDPDATAARAKAEILIEGEGFSEFALRRGNLVSVKARLEVRATETKTGRVLAVDRQVAVVVDLTEQIAGKSALQQAAAQIATRLLPTLVGQ